MHPFRFRARSFIVIAMALILLASVIPLPVSAEASSSGMSTSVFDVTAEADRAHTFHITEQITVDFSTPHHGILRYIPVDREIYEITNIAVPGYESDVTTSSDEVEIRIGDEDTTLTGTHSYEIRYDMVCYRDDDPEKDYLSLNLLPVNWETPIDSSNLTLILPDPIDWSSATVYTGAYGAGTGNGSFTSSTEGSSIRFLGSSIPSRSGLTISSDLPENYWSESETYLQSHKSRLNLFLILSGALSALMLLLWFLFGKDPHIVKPVEFHPPEGMTPAEVGYIIDGSADDTDFMSMILYFAAKGYLEIQETGNEDDFRLVKLRPVDDSEKPFSKTLFNGLFGSKDSVLTSKLPKKYGPTVDSARKQLFETYSGPDKKIFRSSGTAATVAGYVCFAVLFAIPGLLSRGSADWTLISMVIAFFGLFQLCHAYEYRYSAKRSLTFIQATMGGFLISAMALLNINSLFELLPLWILLLYLAAIVVVTACTAFMPSYTTKSAQLQGRILGFRNFIRTAEYDQLKRLSDDNPQYFYRVLPYAAVMGLQTRWARKFTDIPLEAPDWYRHAGDEFHYSVWWAVHMFDDCCVHSVPEVRSGSGSSGSGYSGGFGGSGFAGGGFGGGGGGGW